MPTTLIQNGKYTSFTLTGPFVGQANSPGGATGIGHPPPTTTVVVAYSEGGSKTYPIGYGDTVTLTPEGDLVIELHD